MQGGAGLDRITSMIAPASVPAGSAKSMSIRAPTSDGDRREYPTELDARGPTPPKPVPTIMAALKAIPYGHPQFVRTSEAPIDLLRELERFGVEAYPTQLPDGSWRTLLVCGSGA